MILEAKARYEALTETIKQAQDEQRGLRENIAAEYYTQDEGTQNIEVGETKFKISRTTRREITAANAEKLHAQYPEIAEAVVKWKPSVSTTAAKKHADIVSEYITEKPGLPTIKFD